MNIVSDMRFIANKLTKGVCMYAFENMRIEIGRIVRQQKNATKHARHPKPAQALSRLLFAAMLARNLRVVWLRGDLKNRKVS